jgi:hypothetical protein
MVSQAGSAIFFGKIGYVPLKDPNFRKIPSKDWALEKYHRNLAPSLISTIAVKST